MATGWLKARWLHIKSIGKPWWLLVGGAWGAFWAADAMIAKYGSQYVKDVWDKYTLHMFFDWRLGVIGFLAITLLFVIEGSFRYSSRLRPPDLPSVTGNADLLIHRLNADDLTAIDESKYLINLGIFIRASVAVTDKPRTISAFRLELHADGHKYSAEAEREIGEYWHRFERKVNDGRGHSTIRDVREEMNNLLALVRTTPIAPNTQAEGWLHFEFPNVASGHEPWHIGKLRLSAVDIRNKSYELNTGNIQIRETDSSEYAELKGQQ